MNRYEQSNIPQERIRPIDRDHSGTPEQLKIRSELERAPTLTDFVGVLYDRVPELKSSNNQTFTPEQLTSLMLGALDGDALQRKKITNSTYQLRALIDEKFLNNKEYVPTLSDQLLRRYFRREGADPRLMMPLWNDMPQDDPDFYSRPCPTQKQCDTIMADLQPVMGAISNEKFIQFLLRSKNVFASADDMEDLITIMREKVSIYPDIVQPGEKVKPFNGRTIAVLLEDWTNGKVKDSALDGVLDILKNCFALSVVIRKLALKQVAKRHEQSSEQLRDFIDNNDIRNAMVLVRGRQLKVLGSGGGGTGASLRFYDPKDPERKEVLVVESIEELRSRGAIFTDPTTQQAFEQLSKAA